MWDEMHSLYILLIKFGLKLYVTGCQADLHCEADSDIDGFPVGTRASPGGAALASSTMPRKC